MERKELIKSREYWLTEIQLNLFNLIEDYRKKNKLNKRQLADKLGVTKGYISQILNGDFDHKISKLVDLSLAFDKAPLIHYRNLDEIDATDDYNQLDKDWSFSITQSIKLEFSAGYNCVNDENLNLIPQQKRLSEMIDNINQPYIIENRKEYAL